VKAEMKTNAPLIPVKKPSFSTPERMHHTMVAIVTFQKVD
jgi:hypothetical protein